MRVKLRNVLSAVEKWRRAIFQGHIIGDMEEVCGRWRLAKEPLRTSVETVGMLNYLFNKGENEVEKDE
jgi:hypothetical protein